jgi:hypothetical protein
MYHIILKSCHANAQGTSQRREVFLEIVAFAIEHSNILMHVIHSPLTRIA